MALISAVLLLSLPAFPQGNTGRILGTVTDQSGGYVAGAPVAVTDVARGVTQNLITDSDGAYVALNLVAGIYTVRVEVKGFKVFERKNIQIEVGKDLRVDVVLQPGSATETITITEEVPMVDTTSTTLGGTISNMTINEIPLNGRNYQNLLTLRPGTTIYPGGGPWTQTTNGARPEDTSYMVDGLSNDEAFMGFSVTNAAAVAGDAATILPIDAIQEFNTQVNPKAEFGWKPGAITSVGLKSGTNQIHGSAYAFGRSDSFDARNYFNPVGTAKTPVELEQYGATAGGRIIPDKLFWFGGFEFRNYTVGNSISVNAPTTVPVSGVANCPNPVAGGAPLPGDCANSVPDALANLAAHNIPFSSQSLYILGCPANVAAPYTSCTGGLYGPNATGGKTITGGFPDVDSSRNAIGKVDYHINEKNTLSGSYFFGNDNITAEDAPELLPSYGTVIHSRAQAVAGHYAWTPTTNWANDLRIGYTRYHLTIVPANVGTTYQLNTGLSPSVVATVGGLPNVRISGFTELGGFHNFPKLVGPDNVYDFVDQISNLRGKHALKFGAEYRLDKVNQGTYRGARGRPLFSAGGAFTGLTPAAESTPLESFLAGDVNNASLLAGNPVRHMTQNLFAAFFQDDWRISRNVTLNLGLRYELQGVPSDSNNQLGNFQPSVGLEQVGKNIGSLYNKDATNFAPRVGVAWDVTGNGTTVVRGGASIVYDLLSMSTFLSQQNTNNTVTLGANVVPTGAVIQVGGVSTPGIGNIVASGITLPASELNWNGSSVGGAGIYPSNLVSQVACGDGLTFGTVTDAGPCDIFAMDRNYKTPFVTTWTLGVQHAFSGKLSLDAAYVGNHGSRLTGIQDINQAALGSSPNNQITRPFYSKFPYLEFINYYSNIYRSNYNGLQLAFTGRNYHGLDFVAGYTYSHAIDNQSYNWNQYLPKNSLDPQGEYGNSDFDIRHRFTLSATYTIPGKKGYAQMLEGWQLNGILTLQSGQPWQAIDESNDFSGTGELADRWDIFGSPANFKSRGQSSIPVCVGDPTIPNSPGSCSFTTVSGTVALPTAQGQALWAGCESHLTPATIPSLQAAIAGGTGCYASLNGRTFLLPPAFGTFGNSGRNIFRDAGFHNLDFSVSKSWKFGEKLTTQFRAEMFNITNHPNFANPFGGATGQGVGATADPSVGPFGCGCATPDTASVNPVLGSGGARAIQFGLKFLF
ncbi:MAG TPA: carboxypeptidase regulatory-like domain-containing protein [Candidatus Acidoferrum sp.]|nr:carboxypeptidase regulatory-like domain-containing protein [Candidatus Acidoferrum sp.]